MVFSPTDLMAQGAANGINAVIGAKGGEPPTASPGLVLVDPAIGGAAKAGIGMPGYVPSNATLNSGHNDSSSSASNEGSNGGNAGFDTSNLESKLKGYLLDSGHSQNQTKANWFNQALGFDQSNWQDLASQIRFDPATAVPTKTSQYGQTYEQAIPITGPNGKTIDTTFVFMKDNSGTVRLVTGIPAKK
jgi:filamentous hemagglutinin